MDGFARYWKRETPESLPRCAHIMSSLDLDVTLVDTTQVLCDLVGFILQNKNGKDYTRNSKTKKQITF